MTHPTTKLFIIINVIIATNVQNGLSMYGTSEFEMKMFESGQKQFEMAKQRGSLPRQGECWKSAIASLETGCNQLDENQHAMLALTLADCFLEMSGASRHKCGGLQDAAKRASCIKGMPDRAFGVFTEFFSHVTNMCFYLKSSVWHEIARKTTDSLLTMSMRVDRQMKDMLTSNENLIAHQVKTIALQEQVINNGVNLDEVIKNSATSVARLLSEFQESTMEQRLALLDLSQRLSALQSWAVGEVSWLESLAFFALAVCTAYLTTAWTRAAQARGWIFILLFVGVLLEQAIFKIVLAKLDGASTLFVKENIYFWVWKLRYLIVVLCFMVYLYCIFTYVDYSQENNKLLTTIHDVVLKLQSTTTIDTLDVREPVRLDQIETDKSDVDDNRTRRETSVTFVRVEQKTYTGKSKVPTRSRRKAMAILEDDGDLDSPNSTRYNLRNTPVRQLTSDN
ncbi:uncharacterized protein LOC135937851 isoform X2 [Cloeon dipterum]|uniref:uncharacterized protein LOC135937851 isoform X2 n=1 Tax=Cloeon dipterum TaxID=197152 RepID=UPI00321F80E2